MSAKDGDSFLDLNNKPSRRRLGRPKMHLTGSWARPGKGIRYSIEGDDFVQRINLKNDFGPSSSGKTILVGSSGGPLAVQTLDCAKDYEDLPKDLVVITTLFTLINAIPSFQGKKKKKEKK